MRFLLSIYISIGILNICVPYLHWHSIGTINDDITRVLDMLLYSIALYRIEILHDVFFTLALRSAMSMISIAEYLVQTISVTGVLRWYY